MVGDDSKDLEIAQIEREEEAQELRELREREEISEEIQGASIKKGLSLNAALTVASSVVRFKQKLKNRITSSSPTSTFIAPESTLPLDGLPLCLNCTFFFFSYSFFSLFFFFF